MSENLRHIALIHGAPQRRKIRIIPNVKQEIAEKLKRIYARNAGCPPTSSPDNLPCSTCPFDAAYDTGCIMREGSSFNSPYIFIWDPLEQDIHTIYKYRLSDNGYINASIRGAIRYMFKDGGRYCLLHPCGHRGAISEVNAHDMRGHTLIEEIQVEDDRLRGITPTAVYIDVNIPEQINAETEPKEVIMAARPYKDYSVGDMKRLNLSFMAKHEKKEELFSVFFNIYNLLVSDLPTLVNAKYVDIFCEDGDHTKPILDKEIVKGNCMKYVTTSQVSTEIHSEIAAILESKEVREVDAKVLRDKEMREYKSNVSNSRSMINQNTTRMARLQRDARNLLKDSHERNSFIDEQLAKLHALEAKPLPEQNDISPAYSLLHETVNSMQDAWRLENLVRGSDQIEALFVSVGRRELSYIDNVNGVDESMSLQRVAVWVSFYNTGRVNVYQVRTFPFTFSCASQNYIPDYMHPHYEEGDYPCFGDVEKRASGYLEKGQVAQWFRLFDSILCTYNRDSPYISFSELDDQMSGRHGIINQLLQISSCNDFDESLKRFGIDDYLQELDIDHRLLQLIVWARQKGVWTKVQELNSSPDIEALVDPYILKMLPRIKTHPCRMGGYLETIGRRLAVKRELLNLTLEEPCNEQESRED